MKKCLREKSFQTGFKAKGTARSPAKRLIEKYPTVTQSGAKFSSSENAVAQSGWVRFLRVARWVSLVVCVSILGYRYLQLELDDYVVDVNGDAEAIAVIVEPVGTFTHPTAQHLAELGELLIENPKQRRQAARQLHAVTTRPELLNNDMGAYLALRAAYWQLRRDPDVTGSVEAALMIWDAAERLEQGYQIGRVQAEDTSAPAAP